MYSSLHLFLITAITFLVVRQIDRARRRKGSIPPGPKGWPIAGNARDVANRRDVLWITYYKWAQHFGDVFHLSVFGNHTIVLNSHEAATELLERRSHNYSDRPGEGVRIATESDSTHMIIIFIRHADAGRPNWVGSLTSGVSPFILLDLSSGEGGKLLVRSRVT